MHDVANVPKIIELYALISSMRLLSTSAVVLAAEAVALTIIDTYSSPNKAFPELRGMMENGFVDPLKTFSEVCRKELHTLEGAAMAPFAKSFVRRQLEAPERLPEQSL